MVDAKPGSMLLQKLTPPGPTASKEYQYSMPGVMLV
jgi:hypothetical protein